MLSSDQGQFPPAASQELAFLWGSPGSPFHSPMTLGKLLYLSKPQFSLPHEQSLVHIKC